MWTRPLGFYRDVLGLQFLFRAGPGLPFMEAGGVRVMLSTPQGAGEPGRNSTPYFHVHHVVRVFDDCVAKDATAERAPALAARIPDHDLWIGFLRDPDGNLVGLIEEVRGDAPPVG